MLFIIVLCMWFVCESENESESTEKRQETKGSEEDRETVCLQANDVFFCSPSLLSNIDPCPLEYWASDSPLKL